MQYQIKIIRSSRRTLSLEVKADGTVVARAPIKMREGEIRQFADKKSDWIEKQLKRFEEKRSNCIPVERLTARELDALTLAARDYIPKRVSRYSDIIGVSYGKISIKPLRSKWGSCTSKGNLSFNSLLMLTPDGVIDSIVVHELCHRLEMNHSKRFYSHVLKVYPDYYLHHNWLKENGQNIINRLPEK